MCASILWLDAGNATGQWVQVGGIYMSSVSALELSGSSIVAGSVYGDMFVSTDEGASWTYSGNLGKYYISQIISVPGAGPAGDTLLFAAAFADTGSGVFTSSDGGNTWNADSSLSGYVECLAASGTNIFAGTLSNGIYYSSDAGQHWTAINKGLPSSNGSAIPSVTSLVSNQTGGAPIVYAATFDGSVFSTSDNGSTWDSLGTLFSYINALVLGQSSADTSTLYAGTNEGLYVSSNDGKLWSRVDSAALHFSVNSIAVTNTAIVVGSDSGLYVSTNNGSSWSLANLGIYNPDVISSATSGSAIVAGTNSGGIFLSLNDGAEWMSLNTDLSTYPISSFLSAGSNVFVGTNDGVFVSGNSGASWTPASIGLGNPGVTSLASTGGNVFAGTDSGVYVSSDNGANWTSADSGLSVGSITAMLAVPSSDTTGGLYAGTTNGIFVSTNLGATWARSDSDLTDSSITCLASVQLPGSSYPYVYVGTTSSSTSYATSSFGIWLAQGLGMSVNHVSAIVASEGNIFAGTQGGGIYVSNTYGGSWSPSDSNLTNSTVNCFATTPPLGQAGTVGIFAGTAAGVFMSTDAGVSWSAIGMGTMDYYSITALGMADSFLLAGTASDGVWRLPLSAVVSGIGPSRENVPFSFKLYQNYPNPFNPSTIISYQVPAISRVVLRVYDVLGREVETLVDGKQTPGEYIVRFDGSRYASGVYFCVLRAGGNVQVRKMLLLK